MHAQEKVQAQKRHEKTLHLCHRLILGKDTTYQKKKKISREEEESYFQSYYIIRFKYPLFNNNKKNHKAFNKTEKYGSFKGK